MTKWSSGGGVGHDGALHARLLGAGPPVVLLHGLVGSGRYWGAAYDRIAGHGRQLIVADLLGFGRSPRPAAGYTPDDHADAVIALLDEIGATEPAVLCAHSAGSVVALRLASRHPDRIAAVVAFGPPLYASSSIARAHLAALGPMARWMALPGPIAAVACAWMCNHRALAGRLAVITHPHLPASIARDSVQHDWASYSETLTDSVINAETDAWWPQLQCPVTLVAGNADGVVDRPYLRTLQARGVTSLEEWDGDHHLPVRRADRCVTLLERQLARQE